MLFKLARLASTHALSSRRFARLIRLPFETSSSRKRLVEGGFPHFFISENTLHFRSVDFFLCKGMAGTT